MDYTKIENLPLVHGSYNLGEKLDSILRNGLVAHRTRNITPIDAAAGKDKCVFFRLARSLANYGDGEILIVNPDVANGLGVRFYARDLQGVGNAIRRYLQNPQSELPDFIRDQDDIIKMTNSIHKRLLSQDCQEIGVILANKVYSELEKSKEFAHYLSLYAITKKELYKILVKTWRSNHCTLFEFFERSPYADDWGINEEICVPEVVRPQFLLGYWDGDKYTDFGRQLSSDLQEMLEQFVLSLKL